MAFTLANLVRVASFPSGLNDATTTTSDGFGGTVTRQTEPHNLWMYSSADALTDYDDGTYFAAAGSTSGTGQLKTGDLILLFGTDGSGLGYVQDAAAGAVYPSRASASGAGSQVFAAV